MKKWTTLCLCVALLLAAFSILPVHGEAGIYENVIRLHVLADSDSEEDQARKLLVRDAVIVECEGVLRDVTDKSEAARVLEAALPQLCEAGERALLAAGCTDPVSAQLTKEAYPRRTYESVALPAGEYLSLQVRIGEGEGQNWWCVLFPPMCLSAATAERESACLAAGLTQEQYRMITDTQSTKYKLRFKILEVAQAWLGDS